MYGPCVSAVSILAFLYNIRQRTKRTRNVECGDSVKSVEYVRKYPLNNGGSVLVFGWTGNATASNSTAGTVALVLRVRRVSSFPVRERATFNKLRKFGGAPRTRTAQPQGYLSSTTVYCVFPVGPGEPWCVCEDGVALLILREVPTYYARNASAKRSRRRERRKVALEEHVTVVTRFLDSTGVFGRRFIQTSRNVFTDDRRRRTCAEFAPTGTENRNLRGKRRSGSRRADCFAFKECGASTKIIGYIYAFDNDAYETTEPTKKRSSFSKYVYGVYVKK